MRDNGINHGRDKISHGANPEESGDAKPRVYTTTKTAGLPNMQLGFLFRELVKTLKKLIKFYETKDKKNESYGG